MDYSLAIVSAQGFLCEIQTFATPVGIALVTKVDLGRFVDRFRRSSEPDRGALSAPWIPS
jgi:hypothetical protein